MNSRAVAHQITEAGLRTVATVPMAVVAVVLVPVLLAVAFVLVRGSLRAEAPDRYALQLVQRLAGLVRAARRGR
ncbi:hypothetical protein [Actinomadura parmotrematis]|uniref:Sensor histidine kinase n=1 Tax=Actinomadura parmotrematis TaxID=2864039 RepID=A0ABS7G2E9_9ACTN|nr:hypothetical protein [Actinomadura parmotrematis]MBW8486656.1 hypothetical protein [Actinomadura parmotrematis]